MVQKKFLLKCGTGLCIAAATMMLFSGNIGVRAQVRGTSTGLAGISFFIDQHYAQEGGEVSATSLTAPLSVEDEDLAGTSEPSEDGSTETDDKVTGGDDADAKAATGDSGEAEGAGDTGKAKKAREAEEPVSEYENVGISIANNYVNIRKKPNTDSEIVGKLYQGCAATITETKGEWVKIVSGNAEGYINAEYLAIGFDAEELVDKYGTKYAVVNTETLRVRYEPSVDSKIATLVPQGERLIVTDEQDEWVEISIDDGNITGFVSKEFVEIEVDFEHAVTIEEEEAELRRQQEAEEALRRQQEEQQRRQQQQQASQSNSSQSNSGNSGSGNSSNSNSNKTNTSQKTNQNTNYTENYSGTGAGIASFAQKFVGYPYVYGGTSLTNGADCSGFVQSVYKNFGISIPRDSRSQCAGAGYQVSLDSVQPGDLIFYTNNSGTVNHVAMYIGGGQIVHASDPSSGIKISNMRYCTPYMAKRIVN